jgi:hypothetical protein
MPRFAILKHDHPYLHWDLLLEFDGVLRSWRLECPPKPGRRIPAEPTPDHRLLYLEYEGPIEPGRGTVTQWDGGFYVVKEWEDAIIEIELAGRRLHGSILLTHLHGTDWMCEVFG